MLRDGADQVLRAQEPSNDGHVVPESAWRLALAPRTRWTLGIDQSANSPQSPVRPGGEFFASPTGATQRRYEALRAYLHDGEPAAMVAQRFGYTPASLNSAVRDFRAGAQEFFLTATPGPKTAPAKDAARSRIVELRTDGHSIDEIATALAAEGLGLNRTGVAEVIAERGMPRLWRRPDTARGGPRREVLPRAEPLDFTTLPTRCPTNMAGLPLTIPDLLDLDLPAMVAAAGYPGTRHQRHRGNQLRAQPAGAQAHRDPPGLPRRGPRRRPRCGAVRRSHRAAQDHRADQLLLPARPRQTGRVPDGPGPGHPQSRARHRRSGQPGLPRRQALGTGPGAGKALRAKQKPTHPLGPDILRRRRREPHPALRQRRPVQGHPEQRGPRLRRPLA